MVLKDHTSSVANPGHLLPWNKNQHKYSDLNNTCAVSISLGEELSMAQRPSTRGPTEWPSKCWPGLGLLPGSPLLQVHLAGDRIQFLVSQGPRPQLPPGGHLLPLVVGASPQGHISIQASRRTDGESISKTENMVFCNVVRSDIRHRVGEKHSQYHPHSRGQRT